MNQVPAEVRRKMGGFQIKLYGAVLREEGDEGSRRFRIRSSTEHVDRDGDILRQNWNLIHYRRAPRIFWGHNPDHPIATSLEERVVEVEGVKTLEQLVEFFPEGTLELADTIYRLYRGWNGRRALNQWSVGFHPEKITRVEDEEERAALGLGRWGVVFERSELLETSAVAIPANPHTETMDAMKSLLSEGHLRGHDLDVLEAHHGLPTVMKRLWREARPTVVDMGAGLQLAALAFPTQAYSPAEAAAWAKRYGYETDARVATDDGLELEQTPRAAFDPATLVVKPMGDRVRGVFGRPAEASTEPSAPPAPTLASRLEAVEAKLAALADVVDTVLPERLEDQAGLEAVERAARRLRTDVKRIVNARSTTRDPQ